MKIKKLVGCLYSSEMEMLLKYAYHLGNTFKSNFNFNRTAKNSVLFL